MIGLRLPVVAKVPALIWMRLKNSSSSHDATTTLETVTTIEPIHAGVTTGTLDTSDVVAERPRRIAQSIEI